ncbi:unnamed protein product [Owenia fusiformis]|uniref:Uncharacterized protein n=1 Tax=Owenia fusiformis TaxID=6347 RepID=A0A8S4Q6Z6_OWEFU|nr:unnamed protein product [Owenia fusiformis]
MAPVTIPGDLGCYYGRSILPPRLKWLNEPHKVELKTKDGAGIRIFPDDKTDFWQKTYYPNNMRNNNGHMLAMEIPVDSNVMAETHFNLEPVHQFDQAGLMLRLDDEHWIKTGIEVVDGAPKLSCVVTNVYSDWSTTEWPTNNLTIRLYKLDSDIVVEHLTPNKDTGKWEFMRIARLRTDDTPHLKTCTLGLFACAPTKSDFSVVFDYLSIKNSKGFHHGTEETTEAP